MTELLFVAKKLVSVSEPTTGEGVDREKVKNLESRCQWRAEEKKG